MSYELPQRGQLRNLTPAQPDWVAVITYNGQQTVCPVVAWADAVHSVWDAVDGEPYSPVSMDRPWSVETTPAYVFALDGRLYSSLDVCRDDCHSGDICRTDSYLHGTIRLEHRGAPKAVLVVEGEPSAAELEQLRARLAGGGE